MENTTVQVFGQVEAEHPQIVAYKELLSVISKVKDTSLYLELIRAASNHHNVTYKQGMLDAKSIFCDEPLGYGVSCIAHREDNATIVEPIKAA